METLRVLITVKTYPIPSSKYDELVCTAGVTSEGDFVRLYPINFRDLPFSKQYRKYQWVEVRAEKHKGRDSRKESYRPNPETLKPLGEPLNTKNSWSERKQYVLAKKAQSMEDLYDRQSADRTSLGIFKPKEVRDLVVSPDDVEWSPKFLAALKQARLWEDKRITKDPPRKVPFKFSYRFACDDERCKGNHQMLIEDWEVGALYWRLVDQGVAPDDAARSVRSKFLDELCGPDRETYFYVGTILAHPKSWVVIGVFYPKKRNSSATHKRRKRDENLRLFEDE